MKTSEIEILKKEKKVNFINCLNQRIDIEFNQKSKYRVVLEKADTIDYWNGIWVSDTFPTIESILETFFEKYGIFQGLQDNNHSIANLVRCSVQYGVSGKITLDPNHIGFYIIEEQIFSAMESRKGIKMYMTNSRNISLFNKVKDFGFDKRRSYGSIPYIIVSEIPNSFEKTSLEKVVELAKKEKEIYDNSQFALNMCGSMGWDY